MGVIKHNRKLVIGGVDLVQARLKHIGPAIDGVRDELEAVLIESDFFTNAPFSLISLIIRNGLQNKFEPTYQRISKKYGDLPISVEVDTHLLIGADSIAVKRVYARATVEALIHVGRKYELPVQALERYREDLN